MYLVPQYTTAIRYDTTAPFTSSASWSVGSGPSAFFGGTFDGRYVYFAPSGYFDTFLAARYDTQGALGDAAAWSQMDLTLVNPQAKGFRGALFDGRYTYFVPGSPAGSTQNVVRGDPAGAFDAPSSWAAFDVRTVAPNASGLGGGAFDGRYLYFVPADPMAGRDIVRYDTQAPFANATVVDGLRRERARLQRLLRRRVRRPVRLPRLQRRRPRLDGAALRREEPPVAPAAPRFVLVVYSGVSRRRVCARRGRCRRSR